MAVGDEIYLRGDANREGSIRLLVVADVNADGQPDARLQWLRDGLWLDVATLNSIPASAVVRADGLTAQQVFDSLGTGGGGSAAASQVTNDSSVAGGSVKAALETLAALDALKAVASTTTSALAGKADASATTSALATKADAAATTSALALKADASTTTSALALKQDATPTASVNFNAQKGINLATPTASTDAVTKAYVDALAQGLSAKSACVAATTANITLSGAQTIDGVAVVAGNRVLVKNQTTTSQNGIYVAAAGAWARATDMDTWVETQGAYTLVTGGTANLNTGWVSQTAAGGTLDTTAITFAQFNSASAVSSVLGRTGAVVAQTGDYTVAQVTGAAPLAAPALTGVPTAPTAAAATSTTQIATTAFATGAVSTEATARAGADALLAPLASPVLTGVPAAPTAAGGTSSAQIATTAFVAAAVGTTVAAAQATAGQAGAPATALTATQAQIGTTVTITPRSTLSKVLIVARLDLTHSATATAFTGTARMWRGAVTTGVQVGQDGVLTSPTASIVSPVVIVGVDSPATTAAVSYRLSAAAGATAQYTASRYEIQAVELLWGGFDQTTLVDWTGGASGAVARSVAGKEGEALSVRDFGADPTGAVDSTSAFAAALTFAAIATGVGSGAGAGVVTARRVLVPRGRYVLGPVTVPPHVSLEGEAPYGPGYALDGPTWLSQRAGYTAGQAMLTVSNYATIRNLGLAMDPTTADVDAVSLGSYARVLDCRIMSTARSAIRMPAGVAASRIEGGFFEGLRNVSSWAAPAGVVHAVSDFVDSYLIGVEISGAATLGTLRDATNHYACAVYLRNMSNVWINKCLIENADRGIFCDNFAQNCHIVDNRLELCNAELLIVYSVAYNNSITNNVFGSGGSAAANTYNWLFIDGDVYQNNISDNQFIQYTNVSATNKPALCLIHDGLYSGRSIDKCNSYSNNRFQAAGSNGMTGAIWGTAFMISGYGAPYRLDGVLVSPETGTSFTPNGAFATSFEYTVTAATTIAAPAALVPGRIYPFTVIQDTTGGRAVTWAANFHFAVAAWVNTGNTLNKRSTVLFYAASATDLWQVAAQTPYV